MGKWEKRSDRDNMITWVKFNPKTSRNSTTTIAAYEQTYSYDDPILSGRKRPEYFVDIAYGDGSGRRIKHLKQLPNLKKAIAWAKSYMRTH